MAAKKRNRQQVRAKQAAAARRALEMDRRRRVRKRRTSAAAVVAIVAAVGVVAIVLAQGNDPTTELASTSTTVSPEESIPERLPSAAGKPCLPLADPPPEGAPPVPIKVGPPPTTLVVEDLRPGTGAVVDVSQTLTVNYIGVSCSTGKIFDASYTTGQPATFPLNQVIPGWKEGLPGMKVGGQRLLGIPPDKAYGDEGGPPGSGIAPGESLWFVIDVLDAKAAPGP